MPLTPAPMTFRPLSDWPGPMTEERRPATFTAGWTRLGTPATPTGTGPTRTSST